ncbi:MAG TPA: hypothetical protein VFL55_12870, partial [Acetobacteraceae bacterium]|nr:hypothetical protein [Acetobacteraceae bacterium]
MAATIWKTNANTSDLAIATEPGDQFAPSVADSGGGSFGVAWTSAAGVTARFFDVVGAVDPALGTVQLSDSQGVIAGNAVLAAGGAVGYGAVWQEKTAADATDIGLRLRYVGLSGTVGNEIAVGDVAGTVQHDAAVSGYAVDNPATRKSAVDGINVVYVQTTLATPEVAGDARYGQIMLQRFAVPLDAKVDPIGPPVAAGLDGLTAGSPIAHTELGDAAVNVANAIGRDPTTIVTDDGEAILAWIDAANHVRLQGFTLAGANLNGGIAGADLASLDAGGAGAVTGKVKLVALSGAGFAVAWAAQQPDGTIAIMGRVFSGAAGVYTASPITTLQGGLPGTFNGEFSLGTLVDSGGFSLSWTQGNAGGGQDIMVKNFTSGGLGDNQVSTIASTAGDQNAPSVGALLGDRIIAVYQNDTSTAAGDQDIRATIFDTRTPGVTLNGDIGGNGLPRAIADTLVGTVGNDTLNGLAADDDLHGALGNDTMTGGAGNDLLFGDDGNDVAVYAGTQDQYIVQHLGGDIFTVTDKTTGRDGVDTVSGVETFRFAGVDVSAASIIADIQPITPTPWGQSNADGDTAPDKAGTPDTDGFLVNHVPAVQAGVQTHPFVADSVGEFVGVTWETPGADGNTHIRAQFYDVVGAFDTTSPLPNAIDLSDGVGVETNPALVSGGNNSGWGVTFEQRGNAQDVSRELRTNFVGPGQLTSVELSVDPESDNVDQHSAAMSGSMLDRKLVNGVVQGPDQILPKGMNDGYNVAWVSTDLSSGQPTNVSGDARYGRVMLQRFEVPLDALGNPGAPQAAGVDGLLGVDSDAAVQVAALGRDVSTASLHTFETAVVWIEPEGAGGERVAGKVYDDLGQSFPVAGFDNLSGAFPVAAGTTAKVVMAGAVNFGVVWVTPSTTVPGGFDVMGSYFSSPGTGLNGQGFTLGGFGPVKLFGLPAGTDATALNLAVTGIGGEDSNDLIVGWNDNGDMKAQHIAVALDPVTGVALAMTPEGNPVTVNATTDGIQDQGGLAGLLGDRFFAVYHDTSAIDGDGNDIVGRMFDTRDAANPDPIVGDLIRNGVAQARRDILVGTNGNDNIRGDISDSVGLTDTIYGGMGNDTIQGGPGLKGAAGVPEIIDGGEGTDVAVYTGRRQDYSMTVNGDGSIEVIDLRPIADAQGKPLPNDGIDNLFNMERLRFLATGEEIAISLPGAPGPKPAVPPGGAFDGTPVPWSLTDTSQYKPILLSTDPAGGPGGQPGSQTGVAVTNLQTEAAMAWLSGGSQVWGIRYQVQGRPDPLFSLTPVQLTDGTSAGATVSDIDIGMTAGLGFTTVWKSTANGDSTIHLRTGSTNTNTPLDPAAGVPGAGLTGGEITVGASQDAGTATADEPVVEGYEIVNDANDTLEFGFHIGFVMKAAASDTYGTLELARYEIPVYDVAVDAAGNPVLDANGNGVLARDAAGNLVP